jgi:hypothetical protein
MRTADLTISRTWIWTTVIAGCGAALVACGSSSPPPGAASPKAPGLVREEPGAAERGDSADASLDSAVGKLREEQFQASVSTAREQSHGCYRDLLKQEPEMDVRVVLRLRFDITGNISDMKFDSPPADPAFAKCVKEAWYGVSLPVERDGDLVVPLRFIPEEPVGPLKKPKSVPAKESE